MKMLSKLLVFRPSANMRGEGLLRYSAASHQGADHQEKLSLSRTGSSCQRKATVMKMTMHAVKRCRAEASKRDENGLVCPSLAFTTAEAPTI